MAESPAAFLSYVHFDDEHDNGRITEFRKHLSAEVRVQTGKDFPIFQDKKIEWGENWKKRIQKSLTGSTFLIPVLTPNFFNSEACLEELEIFLKREKQLKRGDLILPVYYIECELLKESNKGTRRKDRLAKILAARQYFDWRELRFEPLTSAQVSRSLAQLAIQIHSALRREEESRIGQPKSRRPRQGKNKPKAIAPITVTDMAGQAKTLEGVQSSAELSSVLAPKTEPLTLIVDQMQRGDYTTIGEAIKFATPGCLILVRRGVYRESVVIDKPLELVADGKLGEVEIRAEGAEAITFQTSMGRFTNFRVTHTGDAKSAGIRIVQGRVDLEDCDVSSDSSLGVIIVSGGADPRMRRNRIHGRGDNGVGISVIGNSLGTIEENEIFDNHHSGIHVITGEPAVSGNKIYKNGQGMALSNTSGVMEDNEIFGNSQTGITVYGESRPILRRNRIHDNTYFGIFFYEKSYGSTLENQIFGNSQGIRLDGQSHPVLQRNQMHDNTIGVCISGDAEGILEDNTISKNKLGVEIVGKSRPVLRRNTVTLNESGGIAVRENGGGTLENNDLRENQGGAFVFEGETSKNIKRTGNTE